MLKLSHHSYEALAHPYAAANRAWLAQELTVRIRKGTIDVEPRLLDDSALDRRLSELTEQAEGLQIESMRDVLAYCCLLLHQPLAAADWEFRTVVCEYLKAIEFPAEKRFDAIHALLPQNLAAVIFGGASESWPAH